MQHTVHCVVVYSQSLDLWESTLGKADLAFVFCAILTGPLLVPVVSKCQFVDLGTLTYDDATAVGLTSDGRPRTRTALAVAPTGYRPVLEPGRDIANAITRSSRSRTSSS